jgi:integrase
MSGNADYCLTKEEADKLLCSIQDLRDKLIISLFLETGINLQELTSIRKDDLADGTLTIRKETTKNKVERKIMLSDELRKLIMDYIEQEKPKQYLLSSRESRNISERRVQQLLDHYSQKSLNRKINPRILRATCIINGFISKIPIPEIEKKVGISIEPYIYHYFKNER